MAAETAKEEKKDAGGGKSKKISQMSLQEVEQALEHINKTMGGSYSLHARQLIARKEILLREGPGR